MNKTDGSQAIASLETEELRSVSGGAGPDLSNLSFFQLTRGSNGTTRARETWLDFDTSTNEGLLSGFQEPVLRRSSNDFQAVDPGWISDSVSIGPHLPGWAKDYDPEPERPPPPPPQGPDGGAGTGRLGLDVLPDLGRLEVGRVVFDRG